MLIAPESLERRMPVREAIEGLLEIVGPIAASFGDVSAIPGVEEILRTGNASDRIRARYRQTGSLPDVVEWLVSETRVGTGIDRRLKGRHDVDSPSPLDVQT
jgi:gamma-glutamyl:cysteine ligase YbdK (ATP-grasp superfamily)